MALELIGVREPGARGAGASAGAGEDAAGAGAGELVVERVRGRSVATRARNHAPLRLLVPGTRTEGVWAYATSLGGGLVDGDALRLRMRVRAGATAMLATQASTKVYRTPRGCSQDLALDVEPGALAAVLPDPVVCFAAARYAQRTTIALAPGASLLYLDALHAGRVARGERWAFDRYDSALTIAREGRTLVADRLLLDPAHGPLAERMGAHDALATLVLLGPRLAAPARALRAPGATQGSTAASTALVGASPLEDEGVVLRMAARTAAELHDALRQTLGFVPELLGDNPFARKW